MSRISPSARLREDFEDFLSGAPDEVLAVGTALPGAEREGGDFFGASSGDAAAAEGRGGGTFRGAMASPSCTSHREFRATDSPLDIDPLKKTLYERVSRSDALVTKANVKKNGPPWQASTKVDYLTQQPRRPSPEPLKRVSLRGKNEAD